MEQSGNLFYQALGEVLECDEVAPETQFRLVDGWCSLKAFGMLVMLENDWGVRMDVGGLARMQTARDLFREAFLAFASGVLRVGRERISSDTEFGSIPEWDSVNHLRLVMETEAKFGIKYRLEDIPGMVRLADFVDKCHD